MCIVHIRHQFLNFHFLQINIEKEIISYLTRHPVSPDDDRDLALAGRIFSVIPIPGSKNIESKPELKGAQLSQLTALGHYIMDIVLRNVIEREVRLIMCWFTYCMNSCPCQTNDVEIINTFT